MKNTGAHKSASTLTLIDSFFRSQPADAAMILESFSVDRILQYLSDVPADSATEIFSHLSPDIAHLVVKEMDNDLFVKIFSRINTHLAARLFLPFPWKEINNKLLLLPTGRSKEMMEFMSYKPDTAGYLMETVVLAFKPRHTVEDVLKRIRKLGDKRITTIYVIQDSGELLGKVAVQVIAISDPQEKLENLVEPVPSVFALSSREEVLQTLDGTKLFQIPVTDVNQKLLGVIRNDALINVAKEEATEDLPAMFGAGKGGTGTLQSFVCGEKQITMAPDQFGYCFFGFLCCWIF